MARGESRKRKPGTPDYRKRFWAAVTAIVVAAGSIGVSHAGFTLPNQAQKQVQMAAAETEPAEQTAKKQVPNAAKRSLELEDAQGIQEADAAAVAPVVPAAATADGKHSQKEQARGMPHAPVLLFANLFTI